MIRPEALLLIALLAPFAGAVLIALLRQAPNLRETATLASALALFCAVLGLLGPVLEGARPRSDWFEVVAGLRIAFAVEPLGLLFALVASCLWIVTSVYSIGYMRANAEPRQTGYYACFAIALGSTVGIAFAENLFTLFLFYEALTLSTYPLVIHRQTPAAIRAGRLYLALLLGTSSLMLLPALIATWLLAGTLDFAPGGILAGKADAWVITMLLALYVFGIGKAAVMPVHFWLPAAMVAPTPVSALLHAVAVVKSGVFAILKIAVLIFGVDTLAALGQSVWLTAVATATILAASVLALRQDDLKRRLAYSTIAQLSYVVLGVAIMTPASIVGAALHIAGHAVGKITLFFASGAVHTAAHMTEVSQLDGIGRRMPWTMGAFTIGALGMIGLPPTAGFLGKWFILMGAVESANWLAVAGIVLSTILTACYLLPIPLRAFFREPAAASVMASEAPLPMVAALTVTAALTLLLFLLPIIPFSLAKLVAP